MPVTRARAKITASSSAPGTKQRVIPSPTIHITRAMSKQIVKSNQNGKQKGLSSESEIVLEPRRLPRRTCKDSAVSVSEFVEEPKKTKAKGQVHLPKEVSPVSIEEEKNTQKKAKAKAQAKVKITRAKDSVKVYTFINPLADWIVQSHNVMDDLEDTLATIRSRIRMPRDKNNPELKVDTTVKSTEKPLQIPVVKISSKTIKKNKQDKRKLGLENDKTTNNLAPVKGNEQKNLSPLKEVPKKKLSPERENPESKNPRKELSLEKEIPNKKVSPVKDNQNNKTSPDKEIPSISKKVSPVKEDRKKSSPEKVNPKRKMSPERDVNIKISKTMIMTIPSTFNFASPPPPPPPMKKLMHSLVDLCEDTIVEEFVDANSTFGADHEQYDDASESEIHNTVFASLLEGCVSSVESAATTIVCNNTIVVEHNLTITSPLVQQSNNNTYLITDLEPEIHVTATAKAPNKVSTTKQFYQKLFEEPVRDINESLFVAGELDMENGGDTSQETESDEDQEEVKAEVAGAGAAGVTEASFVGESNNYEISRLEDIVDEQNNHRTNKKIPMWAKDPFIEGQLYLTNPDLLGRLFENANEYGSCSDVAPTDLTFPLCNSSYKVFPGAAEVHPR